VRQALQHLCLGLAGGLVTLAKMKGEKNREGEDQSGEGGMLSLTLNYLLSRDAKESQGKLGSLREIKERVGGTSRERGKGVVSKSGKIILDGKSPANQKGKTNPEEKKKKEGRKFVRNESNRKGVGGRIHSQSHWRKCPFPQKV